MLKGKKLESRNFKTGFFVRWRRTYFLNKYDKVYGKYSPFLFLIYEILIFFSTEPYVLFKYDILLIKRKH